ncbi:MAG TPA: hypothetical protein VG296_15585 [Actinospica sp.]|nr:hypothetical protein [Actinospica sp.]
MPLAGLAVLDEPQRVEIGEESQPPMTMLGVGAPRCGAARSLIVPGGLLNSSMTACSGVGGPIARTLPDSLSPTTEGLDDARVALSLQQEHFEHVRRLPCLARAKQKPRCGQADRTCFVADGAFGAPLPLSTAARAKEKAAAVDSSLA